MVNDDANSKTSRTSSSMNNMHIDLLG
jgi:hypothetical protein